MPDLLSEKTLYEIISIAIEKERDAQALYRQAIQLAHDHPEIRRQFERYEREEKRHEQELMESYATLKALLSAKR
jgi:rubrerythrin